MKKLLYILLLGGVTVFLADWLGFDQHFQTGSQEISCSVTGIFPQDVDMTILLNGLVSKSNDINSEKRTRRRKFNKRTTQTISGSKEPQTVTFDLSSFDQIGQLKLLFTSDSVDVKSLTKKELKQLKYRFQLSEISVLINGAETIWSDSSIVEGWKASDKMKLKVAKNGLLKGNTLIQKGSLELKNSLNYVSTTDHENRPYRWLNWLVGLFISAVTWVVIKKSLNGKNAAHSVVLPILFLLSHIVPHFDGAYTISQEYTNAENRSKANLSSLQGASLKEFPKIFNQYYADNFGLREVLIELNCKIKYTLFGESPFPAKVTLGKDKWMFKSEFIPDYCGQAMYTAIELDSIAKKFQRIHERCEQDSIKYYLYLTPDKFSIYPQYLPKRISQNAGTRKYDQVVDHLKSNTNVRVIESMDLLKEKSNEYELFHKSDLHWNEAGAYYGYVGLMRALQKDFPQLTAYPVDSFKIKMKSGFKGGHSKMIYLEEEFAEEQFRFQPRFTSRVISSNNKMLSSKAIVRITDREKAPSCLIFRDSFFNNLLPFTGEHFSQSAYVKNADREKNPTLEQALLSKMKPDILIHQMAQNAARDLLEY